MVFRQFLVALSILLTTAQSFAYFSTIDTGDLLERGKYRAILEPQIILDRYDGLNFVGRFDSGLTEDANVRALVGFGKVDFQMGGFFKYVPFPDVDKQPAIGGEAGILYARVNGETEFSLRIHPLVSKKFATEIGDLTPYVSLPLGITNRASDTFVPVQLVGGSEWKTLKWDNLRFFAEVGLNINHSFGYISGAVAYYFDDPTGH